MKRSEELTWNSKIHTIGIQESQTDTEKDLSLVLKSERIWNIDGQTLENKQI